MRLFLKGYYLSMKFSLTVMMISRSMPLILILFLLSATPLGPLDSRRGLACPIRVF
jgi:hypothetical protein